MSKRFLSDSPTIDDILSLKRPNERVVPILMDSSLKHQIEQVEKQISRLGLARKSTRGTSLADSNAQDMAAAQKHLGELLAEAEDATVHFVLRDIGRKKFENLRKQHPPTDDDVQFAKDHNHPPPEFNLEEFPKHLIAACSVAKPYKPAEGVTYAPALTLEAVTQIFDDWSNGDVEDLYLGAIMVCSERTTVPFTGSSIGATPNSEPSSTTALNGESPTPNT